MGPQYRGTALAWQDARKFANHIKSHGITQFMHVWDRNKDRCDDFLWGDEIEYMIIYLDHAERNAKLSLRQAEILQQLNAAVSDSGQQTAPASFQTEYGRYMLETTPGSPYTGGISDLLSVESNMRNRRRLARKHMKPNEILATLTSFPRLGVASVFTEPHFLPENAISSHSLFLPEEVTTAHVRFPTLTANIRCRRGSKVAINLPLFMDEKTPSVDPTIPYDRNIYPEDPEAKNGAALVDHVYMDAMGFGMGCCCLQVTMQACNVTQARRLYDALIPIAPILLAFTAASPLWRGYLADVDCRWDVIAGSVDDRTEEERGLKPLKENQFRIPKSRYDSVDVYISTDSTHRPEYDDIPVPYDEKIFKRLREHGIDDLLSKHFAHLFIRDPLVIFAELLDQDDTTSTDHFENIQSTNWQTLRLKPPPPGTSIGWRVEFRSMEIQVTDYENAAFALFVVLLSRAILKFELNMYMPISKVDNNMARAQRRDASRSEKFFFRKDVYLPGRGPPSSACSSSGEGSPSEGELQCGDGDLRNCYGVPHNYTPLGPVEEEYQEMSMDEIMNGKSDTFPGLLNLVYMYLDTLHLNQHERDAFERYLGLIRARSKGELLTTATWIRNFVRSHPAYKFDSVVSQEINYDLVVAIDEIEQGVRKEPSILPDNLLGNVSIQRGHGLLL